MFPLRSNPNRAPTYPELTIDLLESLLEAIQYPETRYYTITPDLADYVLKHRNGNVRVINVSHVAKLAISMEAGHFPITNSGVGFCTDKLSADAHHRLHAVIKSKTSIVMGVTFGLDPEVREFIDIDIRKRALEDVISRLVGDVANEDIQFHHSRVVASGLVRLVRWLGCPIRNLRSTDARQVIKDEYLETLKFLDAFRSRKGVSNPFFGTMAYAYLTNPEAIEELAQRIQAAIRELTWDESVTTAETKADFVLYKYLRRSMDNNAKGRSMKKKDMVDKQDRMAEKVLVALHAHLTNRPLKKLTASQGEILAARNFFYRAHADINPWKNLAVNTNPKGYAAEYLTKDLGEGEDS